MPDVIAPGCALLRHKPHLAERLKGWLGLEEHLTCCHHPPGLPAGTRILDACPTRTEERAHRAIRTLLARMDLRLAEPGRAGSRSTCCGDSFCETLPVEELKGLMRKRAAEMPCPEVVVYCVSCAEAMHIGGRAPRYLVELLFGEETPVGTFEPDARHGQVQAFIDAH